MKNRRAYKVPYAIAAFLLFLALSLKANAQFISASVGINGLTCSLCEKGVEKEIRKLSFVQDVSIDLEHTMATITFKPGSTVSMDQVARKIVNAGFSVRSMVAEYNFDHFAVDEGSQFKSGKATYEFIHVDKKELNGTISIRFVGEEFMSKDDYNSYRAYVQLNASNQQQFPIKSDSFYFVTE